ncbi:hypothetical protein J2Z81_002957 [Virgibacillus campisalis]|uniref:Uncharacterized protein n=1 Tax=Virgibacillus alimentarius TaxID=698769 RepID=A0ABS4SC37_9BACI|nr:hypothetical protein [Virgibacillus alimentarius]
MRNDGVWIVENERYINRTGGDINWIEDISTGPVEASTG